MDNTVVKIKEASYSIGRLSAKKQFAVARRLSPFIGDIVPNIKKLISGLDDVDEGAPISKESLLDRAAVLVPQIVHTLATMKDEDCDFIFDACLAVVKVQRPEGWFPLTTPDGGTMMYHDLIELPEMLQLTAEVVKANLMGFFPIDKLMVFAAKMGMVN